MIDIFNSNAFQMRELAAALKTIPYKPTRLGPTAAGGLGLFHEGPISTTALMIEETEGRLTLIGSSPRGSAGDSQASNKRKMRPFAAQHLKRTEKVFADEVQGVREFGSEDAMQTIESLRDERLATLQLEHEVTWEYHRVGALTGKVLDADGTTVLLDLFTAFEVSQQTHEFDFVETAPVIDVRNECVKVARKIENELGGSMYEHLHAFCGKNFMDSLLTHESVKDALKYTEGRMLLTDLRKGFTVGGITFEEYTGSVKNPAGSMVQFVADDEAYVFPVGAVVPGSPAGALFLGRFAPPPFIETVNKRNPPLVTKAVVDPAGQFIELIGISCPVYICTKPRAVVKCTLGVAD